MRKGEKITLITGVSLAIVGLILALAVLMLNGFRLANVYNLEERIVEHELNSSLNDISLDIVEADAIINLSTDNKNKLVIKETNKIYNEVIMNDDSLAIKRKDKLGLLSYFVPTYSYEMEVSLYLNKESLNKLQIKTVSGNIKISSINARSLSLESKAGLVEVLDAKADSLSVNTISGAIIAKGISTASLNFKTISGAIEAENAYNMDAKISTVSGSVDFSDYECDRLSVESVSGQVKIVFLTDKNFQYKTISGRYVIPNSVSGAGIVSVKTTSGNILLYIKNRS